MVIRKRFIVFLLLLFIPSLVSARIVFTSRRDGRSRSIYVMDDDGGNLRRLTLPPHYNSFPVWSPNGKYIIFSRSFQVEELQFGRQSSLFIINRDGSNERRLTHTPTFDKMANWAPDSRRIVFSSNRSGKLEIHVMDITTGEISQLTHSKGKAWATSPSWSPNGRFIAYRYSPPDFSPSTIYVMKVNGQSPNPLIKTDEWTRYGPKWSPDSKSILYFEATYIPAEQGFGLDKNNVVIQEYKNPNRRQILNIPRGWLVHDVAWMDDGKQVLITAEEWKADESPIDIYRFHLTTNEITNLTNHRMIDFGPNWISDRALSVTPLDKKKTQWGTLKNESLGK